MHLQRSVFQLQLNFRVQQICYSSAAVRGALTPQKVHKGSQSGTQETRVPLIEIPRMIKMWQQSLLFLQFQFLLAFSHTTVQ